MARLRSTGDKREKRNPFVASSNECRRRQWEQPEVTTRNTPPKDGEFIDACL